LLDHLIKHKSCLPTTDYQHLITYFLRAKCIDANSAYATRIRTNQSILSSINTFKMPNQLIDKRSNKLFTSFFEDSDGHFLNEDFYGSDVVMFALGRLGLISSKLPDEFVLCVARRVQQLKGTPEKARQLSKSLLKYCELNPITSALSNKLRNIEWVTVLYVINASSLQLQA
jgi:hypothetical protein